MKTIKYLLAALLFGFFFVSCETESLEEINAENAALLEYDQQSRTLNGVTEDDRPIKTDGDDDIPPPEGKDPTDGDDDIPPPEGKDPTDGDDDIPPPEGKDPTDGDDDIPPPEGKDPTDGDDDIPPPVDKE